MKVDLGVRDCLYPSPTTLVGALVDGKPNYATVAHVGIVAYVAVSLSMGKMHHTNIGIRANGTFSVNIPSTDMAAETDYCGLVSGRDVDKSSLFQNFCGKLDTAPMIGECPVSMECRLVETVDFRTHDVFIGEIVATYCEESCLSDGMIDLTKVKPILFMNDRRYYELGPPFAHAFQIGKGLKKS